LVLLPSLAEPVIKTANPFLTKIYIVISSRILISTASC
jgi:hypothetical protein